MAKKNKQRPKPQVTPVATPDTPADDTNVEEAAPPAVVAPRAPRAPKLSRSQMASERLEDEYAYITGDLRRVFILAGAMFALLIVLNVILSRVGG